MHPPKPALLQPRLPAWRAASLCFLALSTSFSSPIFVQAGESLGVASHGASQLGPAVPASEQLNQAEAGNLDMEGSDGYAPDFAYLDRSIIGRQSSPIPTLSNNQKAVMDISPGATLYFVIPKGQPSARRSEHASKDALAADDIVGEASPSNSVERDSTPVENVDTDEATVELRKRQTTPTIFISATTCRQPTPVNNGSVTPGGQGQLSMYISTSPNQKPGSNGNASNYPPFSFDKGYALMDVSGDRDIYVGISAPSLSSDWGGIWNFEIAASTDGLYHQYNDTDPFLYMIDTDDESALFITPNISTSDDANNVDQLKNQNPFKMYAFAASGWTSISGMEHSYCALKNQFNANSTSNSSNFTITANITTKFVSDYPKSQFLVKGLEAAKTYKGFLVVDENQWTSGVAGVGTVRGGGLVFKSFDWTTKADDSCQVLTSLNFCDSVAYAVPSSPDFKDNPSGLGDLYDQQAQAYYKNFTNSLAQVACQAVPEAQYSLAVNCSLCARYYKDWLCSVLIPRCESFSATDPWLQARNINVPFPNGTLPYANNVSQEFNNTRRNRFAYAQSRNPMIDEQIKPGPYKELKPCSYLCNDIVRACPAQLQFQCPSDPALDLTYGMKDPTDNSLQCNFPGAVVKLNVQGAAVRRSAGLGSAAPVAIMVAALLWI